MYEVRLDPQARRHLLALSDKAAAAIFELLAGDLGSAPHRIGKPLRWDLEGLWSARRGESRLVYEIDDDTLAVIVVRIEHRRDLYRTR